MAQTPPTTAGLSAAIVSQLEASVFQQIPFLPKSFSRVLAKVLAGTSVTLWKYAGFNLLQQFIRHAAFRETEVNGRLIRPLVEWGIQLGAGEPDDATRAEHLMEITVLEQVGSLPAQTQMLRVATGVVYHTLSAVALDDDTVQVTVRAVGDPDGNGGVGEIGNLAPGDVLTIVSAPGSIESDAVVVDRTVTGTDGESEEDYRARVERHAQRRPQGGAGADYDQWGGEPAGVVAIYPYTGDPGEVDVFVEVEATEGNPDGIPSSDQLDSVRDSIELTISGLATRRPVNAAVNTLPITRRAFGVRVVGLSDDDLEEEIADGLDEFFRTREPFIVGLSVLPREDRITQAAVSAIVNDIVNAAGASVTAVALTLDDDEIQTYVLSRGEKTKLDGDPAFV